MKAVGYCATRNLYPRLIVAVNSLLKNNPNIGKVYCFLEDEEYKPFKDERIEVIKVDKYNTPFWRFSPNFNSVFTYMSLIRLAFAQMLPYLDKILYLDVDTIVDQNIEELWSLDMTDKAVAGKRDLLQKGNDVYLNAGVLLMNLEYIRANKLDYKMFDLLNVKELLEYPDQDVMNKVCEGHKQVIGDEYNLFSVELGKTTPKIVHYAGFHCWWDSSVKGVEYYNKYKCVSI